MNKGRMNRAPCQTTQIIMAGAGDLTRTSKPWNTDTVHGHALW